VKPYRIIPIVGAIGLIGGALFVASGPASAVAAPGVKTMSTSTSTPCGKTGTAGTTSCTYDSTGTDTFTVPRGVTVATFKLDGAQGGSYPGTAPGGLGGSVTATISVTPNQVFQVNVGAHGSDDTSGGANSGSGGGGSSDVRIGRFRDTDRELVAGGGGGSGGSRSTSSELGGAGGNGGGGSGRPGSSGSTVAEGGAGATTKAGGKGGSGPGARGASGGKRRGGEGGSDGSRIGGPGGLGGGASGGVGVPSTKCPGGGGGGGGGYFGGGGGGAGWCKGGGGGGGGGSNYADPTARAVTFGVGVRSGNGRVSVSWPAGTVTFIGDSVTAGFGYCGASENASKISCAPNEAFADAWIGENSLRRCKPPAVPNDACSNNNYNGKPWLVPPWSPGPKSPDVAYPYQIAASQSGTSYAAVSDWAMTGATPANWDPGDGRLGPELRKIDDQYVVMTLGANPILSDFTYITYAGGTVTKGPCVDSTGYESGRVWYSGPFSRQLNCVAKQWDADKQTQHLVSIYERLLSQGDHVLVLGYYRACSWSFGNWQPAGNVRKGPSKGYSCISETRDVSRTDRMPVTQWEQAITVGENVNTRIHDAMLEAQAWAKREWPGTDRYQDIAWTTPNQNEWFQHQPLSSRGSWIFLNDTWIHPNKDGAAQLADTVANAMCTSFGHWCGGQRAWG
jgi:hypothetical protein